MPATSEAFKQDLDQLTTGQLQQIANFIAFLNFRDKRRHIVLAPDAVSFPSRQHKHSPSK
jgi:hypothetical protein